MKLLNTLKMTMMLPGVAFTMDNIDNETIQKYAASQDNTIASMHMAIQQMGGHENYQDNEATYVVKADSLKTNGIDYDLSTENDDLEKIAKKLSEKIADADSGDHSLSTLLSAEDFKAVLSLKKSERESFFALVKSNLNGKYDIDTEELEKDAGLETDFNAFTKEIRSQVTDKRLGVEMRSAGKGGNNIGYNNNVDVKGVSKRLGIEINTAATWAMNNPNAVIGNKTVDEIFKEIAGPNAGARNVWIGTATDIEKESLPKLARRISDLANFDNASSELSLEEKTKLYDDVVNYTYQWRVKKYSQSYYKSKVESLSQGLNGGPLAQSLMQESAIGLPAVDAMHGETMRRSLNQIFGGDELASDELGEATDFGNALMAVAVIGTHYGDDVAQLIAKYAENSEALNKPIISLLPKNRANAVIKAILPQIVNHNPSIDVDMVTQALTFSDAVKIALTPHMLDQEQVFENDIILSLTEKEIIPAITPEVVEEERGVEVGLRYNNQRFFNTPNDFISFQNRQVTIGFYGDNDSKTTFGFGYASYNLRTLDAYDLVDPIQYDLSGNQGVYRQGNRLIVTDNVQEFDPRYINTANGNRFAEYGGLDLETNTFGRSDFSPSFFFQHKNPNRTIQADFVFGDFTRIHASLLNQKLSDKVSFNIGAGFNRFPVESVGEFIQNEITGISQTTIKNEVVESTHTESKIIETFEYSVTEIEKFLWAGIAAQEGTFEKIETAVSVQGAVPVVQLVQPIKHVTLYPELEPTLPARYVDCPNGPFEWFDHPTDRVSIAQANQLQEVGDPRFPKFDEDRYSIEELQNPSEWDWAIGAPTQSYDPANYLVPGVGPNAVTPQFIPLPPKVTGSENFITDTQTINAGPPVHPEDVAEGTPLSDTPTGQWAPVKEYSDADLWTIEQFDNSDAPEEVRQLEQKDDLTFESEEDALASGYYLGNTQETIITLSIQDEQYNGESVEWNEVEGVYLTRAEHTELVEQDNANGVPATTPRPREIVVLPEGQGERLTEEDVNNEEQLSPDQLTVVESSRSIDEEEYNRLLAEGADVSATRVEQIAVSEEVTTLNNKQTITKVDHDVAYKNQEFIGPRAINVASIEVGVNVRLNKEKQSGINRAYLDASFVNTDGGKSKISVDEIRTVTTHIEEENFTPEQSDVVVDNDGNLEVIEGADYQQLDPIITNSLESDTFTHDVTRRRWATTYSFGGGFAGTNQNNTFNYNFGARLNTVNFSTLTERKENNDLLIRNTLRENKTMGAVDAGINYTFGPNNDFSINATMMLNVIGDTEINNNYFGFGITKRFNQRKPK